MLQTFEAFRIWFYGWFGYDSILWIKGGYNKWIWFAYTFQYEFAYGFGKTCRRFCWWWLFSLVWKPLVSFGMTWQYQNHIHIISKSPQKSYQHSNALDPHFGAMSPEIYGFGYDFDMICTPAVPGHPSPFSTSATSISKNHIPNQNQIRCSYQNHIPIWILKANPDGFFKP